MSDERRHTTKIMAVGGNVLMSLLDDDYIRMTPKQARQIGGRLLLKAAEAEGLPAPAIVALMVED